MVAVDESRNLVYSLGRSSITVLSYNKADSTVSYLASVPVEGTTKKIAVCRGNVFVTTKEGYVVVFRAYNAETGVFKLINSVEVGPTPTHFEVYDSCSRLIIAHQSYLVEQPGKIVILNFADGIKAQPTVKELTFESYQAENILSDLSEAGLVKNGASFLQPKWVSINQAKSKAYVSFRMNNAIAVVDLATEEILSVKALGFKDWSATGNTEGFDGDSVSAIKIQNSPLSAVYNPDNLQSITLGGKDYLFTANAGSKSTAGLTTLDALRVEADLEADKAEALRACQGLAVLSANNTDFNNNGLADKIVTIGGRSVSVFDSTDFSLLDDTGSGIEASIAAKFPEGFNADAGPSDTLADVMDDTSSLYGPGVETLTAAKICDNSAVLVVAATRYPGTLHFYTVDKMSMTFEEQDFEDGYVDKSSSLNDKKLYTSQKLKMKDISTLALMTDTDGSLKLLVGSRRVETLNIYSINVTC